MNHDIHIRALAAPVGNGSSWRDRDVVFAIRFHQFESASAETCFRHWSNGFSIRVGEFKASARYKLQAKSTFMHQMMMPAQ